MSLGKSDVGTVTYPPPSSRSDLIASPTTQMFQILAFVLDLRERKVVDFATPPDIDLAQADGKLRDHVERLV